MKQSSEDIDPLVRQAFQSLPDTPPPGSSFDSQRLWSQLNHELHPAKPARRLAGWWWMAGMLFLLAGLGWYIGTGPSPGNENGTAVVQQGPKQPSVSVGATSGGIEEARPVGRNSVSAPAPSLHPKPLTAQHPPATTRQRVEAVAIRTPESPSPENPAPIPAQELVATREPGSDLTSPGVEPKPVARTLAKAAKPRFRVVHINEWQTEEDVKTSLRRNEGLVRLGTGGHSADRPESPQLQISISQRIK
ncbi:hypothetical protein [Nibrella viscosa]|uniref:hypothetical protein n=1 Tax=Nibrella viscosa TaxID=1084524 RepID=UPI0031F17A6B